jgi:hypothetical protein
MEKGRKRPGLPLEDCYFVKYERYASDATFQWKPVADVKRLSPQLHRAFQQALGRVEEEEKARKTKTHATPEEVLACEWRDDWVNQPAQLSFLVKWEELSAAHTSWVPLTLNRKVQVILSYIGDKWQHINAILQPHGGAENCLPSDVFQGIPRWIKQGPPEEHFQINWENAEIRKHTKMECAAWGKCDQEMHIGVLLEWKWPGQPPVQRMWPGSKLLSEVPDDKCARIHSYLEQHWQEFKDCYGQRWQMYADRRNRTSTEHQWGDDHVNPLPSQADMEQQQQHSPMPAAAVPAASPTAPHPPPSASPQLSPAPNPLFLASSPNRGMVIHA